LQLKTKREIIYPEETIIQMAEEQRSRKNTGKSTQSWMTGTEDDSIDIEQLNETMQTFS